jgi:hypothetical protein
MKSFKKEQDALGHGRPGARSSPRMNSPCQHNWFIIFFLEEKTMRHPIRFFLTNLWQWKN